MKRDYQLDTIKGILIFLVVFSHMFEPTATRTHEIVRFIYLAIFSFHMPIFVFISGFFSKKHKPEKLIELFLIYCLWQALIYPLFISTMLDQTFSYAQNALFNPEGSYWYLLSLIIWRIITPYTKRIKYMLPLTIVFGLIVGLSEISSMTTFSYGRTIAFYPFFFAGFSATKEHLALIKQKVNRYAGFIGFIVLMLTATLFAYYLVSSDIIIRQNLITKPFALRDRYELYLTNPLSGIFVRSVLYTLAFGMTALIFSFISSKQTIFSRIGQNSFIIYISHYMIIDFVKKKYLADIEAFDSILVLTVCFVITGAYCYILSTDFVQKYTRYLTSFNIKRILKDETNPTQTKS